MTASSSIHSPFVMIIFGATGGLARHKLFPALFSLYKQKQLPEKFFIIGFSRRPYSDEDFRSFISEDLPYKNEKFHKEFLSHLFYQEGLFDEKKGYLELIETLNGFDTEMGACIMRLFYLATPPDNYEIILDTLQQTKLSEGCGQGSEKWTKVIIEKPFGKDLETARHLDLRLSDIFEEKQIFRVDHYLGKETIQNMLVFRFANSMFEPIWNNEYIDHVQITWSESGGIGTRGKFFEGVGMLRDVGQNHIMQMIAAVAMEQPKSFSKEGVRDARAKAVEAIRKVPAHEVMSYAVRGQHENYTKEKDVPQHSLTETFVAMKLFVDTKRFQDVPFYIRAGKYMPENRVDISIVFKQTCHLLFREIGCPEVGNILTIRTYPNEGISLRVIAKKPGSQLSLGDVDMKFSYKEEFGGAGTDANVKLLLDIFAGDQMLFNRSDELESSWQLITAMLQGWEQEKDILKYSEKTWGPKEADELIEKDGRKWL